jgi:hypothetical protein
MARGFVYLAVVLDWFSRRALSWRWSITMEAAFCVATLEDALECHANLGRDPLIEAENLFRQPAPPHETVILFISLNVHGEQFCTDPTQP